MDHQSAANAYRTMSIETAPPIKIVRLLYQGAIRFLDRALAEDVADPRSRFGHYLGRADAIVTELRLAIDHTVETEVTRDLERLYLFCEDQIGKAGIDRSIEPVQSTRKVLEILLDAWQRVEVETTPVA